MVCFKLVAVSDHAKQLTMCEGRPDLLLWQDKPVHLGRAVKTGDGYRFPNTWNSLSSYHCRLDYQGTGAGEGQWLVTDTSTNGTYINGCKVGKDKSAVVKVDDILGLSVITPATAVANVVTVEYRLQLDTDAPTPHAPVASAATTHSVDPAPSAGPSASLKRRQEASVSPNARSAAGVHAAGGHVSGAAVKRPRSEETDQSLLQQLKQSNNELRAKNEAADFRAERLEQVLQQQVEQHGKELQERDDKHHAELRAAEQEAAQRLDTEVARSKQLEQQLADLTSSTAEQKRIWQIRLTELEQQLAAKSEEAERLSAELQQARDGVTARDADLLAVKAALAEQQQANQELQLKLACVEAEAAGLRDAQQQLQARADKLAEVQQQLQQEQRLRVAAEAAASKVERALVRAKASLQDKLDSERENLLVYGRNVREAHAGLVKKLLDQQAEAERHQRETQQLNAQLKALLEQAAAESSRHSSAVCGLVSEVEEDLQQLAAASVEAGIALAPTAAPGATAGAGAGGGPDDMEEDLTGQAPTGPASSQPHPQDAPMTQPLRNTTSSDGGAGTLASPHHSQAGGAGALTDALGTPAATQDHTSARGTGMQAGTAHVPPGSAAAAALASGTPAAGLLTDQLLATAAPGTAAIDFAGQTQEVFPATLALPGTLVFPVLGTAAAAAAAAAGTPELQGTQEGLEPGCAPAPSPATAAKDAEGARGAVAGDPAALQQRFQAQLAAALLLQQHEEQQGQQEEQQEGQQDDEDMLCDEEGLQEQGADCSDNLEDDDGAGGRHLRRTPVKACVAAAAAAGAGEAVTERGSPAIVPGSEDATPGQQQPRPSQGDMQMNGQQQEVPETDQETQLEDDVAHDVIQQQQQQQRGGASDAALDAAGVGGVNSQPGLGEDRAEGSQQLGRTDEHPSSSLPGSSQQQQQQQQQASQADDEHLGLQPRQQQTPQHQQQGHQQQHEAWHEGQALVGSDGHCSTYPQQKAKPPKSLLGSSGSPARPHSQPMTDIDLNQQLHYAPVDPYRFQG